MGRRQINHEQTPARFAAGTLARIDARLEDGESRTGFIRQAVERELIRREQEHGLTPAPEVGPES